MAELYDFAAGLVQGDQQRAVTQGVQLDNQAKQIALTQQQKLMQLMQDPKNQQALQGAGGAPGAGQNSPDGVANALRTEGLMEMQAGMFTDAKDTFGKLSTIDNQTSLIQRRGFQNIESNIKIDKAEAAEVGRVMQGVTDQQSWNDALMYLMRSGQPVPQEIVQMGYSPENVQKLITRSQDYIKNADLAVKQANEKLNEKRTNAYIQELKDKHNTSKIMAEYQARREGTNKATGSKAPAENVIKDMTDALGGQFKDPVTGKDSTSDADKRIMAVAWAEETDKVLATNPGMNRAQAMANALDKLKREGLFKALDEAHDGKSPFRPTPYQTNRTQLNDGQYYSLPKTKQNAAGVYEYNAKLKQMVGPINTDEMEARALSGDQQFQEPEADESSGDADSDEDSDED